MKKLLIVCFIVAGSLILAGGMLFAGVMTALDWNFKNLSTTVYEITKHTVTDEFSDISITCNVETVSFLPSNDEKVTVICHEDQRIKHLVSVENGVLTIKRIDTKHWYDYIGINFGSPTITIYLPTGEYGNLNIKSTTGDVYLVSEHSYNSINIEATTADVSCTSSTKGDVNIKLDTGDITIDSISAKSLNLEVTTGDISVTKAYLDGDVSIEVSTGRSVLDDINCNDFYSDGSTGDLTMRSVIATGKFDIERSTGDITLEACDASDIYIVTDTGDVSGSLLSEKVFITKTDTGDIRVPSSVVGGKCEITTDTGDIEITVR